MLCETHSVYWKMDFKVKLEAYSLVFEKCYVKCSLIDVDVSKLLTFECGQGAYM